MHRRQCRANQPDLFSVENNPPPVLPGEVRESALPWIEALLREAAAGQRGLAANHEDHR